VRRGQDFYSAVGYYNYPQEIVFASETDGWIVSFGDEHGGTIIHTSDGGTTWAPQYSSDWSCALVTFINADTGWAIAADDSLIHTTNGGAEWSGIQIPGIGRAGILRFYNALNGWRTTGWDMSGLQFLHTGDGGATWDTVFNPCTGGILDLEFADANHGWAVGSSGAILHYNGTTSAAPVRNARPIRAFTLSAYPNPFNPNTTLSFDVPVNSRVRIMVYDITGRLVQTLADRVYPQGNYRVEFDGSVLPSGIYFARLQGTSLSKTQKLVLLK
jgi:hypothetical protein